MSLSPEFGVEDLSPNSELCTPNFYRLIPDRNLCRKLKLGSLPPGIIGRIAEIIDQVMGEFQTGLFKEFFPTDPFGPFSQPFIFPGIRRIDLNDVPDAIRGLRPAGYIIGQEGHNDLGKLRRADPVGDLAADHDDDSVAHPHRPKAWPGTWYSSFRRTYSGHY